MAFGITFLIYFSLCSSHIIVNGCIFFPDEKYYDLIGTDSNDRPIHITMQIVNDLLGPYSDDGIRLLEGGDLAPKYAEELECSFQSRCCWFNIEAGNDDLEWVIVHEPINKKKSLKLFQTLRVPEGEFAITAAAQSHDLTYAMLSSCPITCQTEAGILIFQHWMSQGVIMDVCILPITRKRRNFTRCHTIRNVEPVTVEVHIPKMNIPFQIVIVASSFYEWPGGVAAVDNIEYAGLLCGDKGSGETSAEYNERQNGRGKRRDNGNRGNANGNGNRGNGNPGNGNGGFGNGNGGFGNRNGNGFGGNGRPRRVEEAGARFEEAVAVPIRSRSRS